MPVPENSIAIWDERHPLANFAPIKVRIRNGQDNFGTSEELYQLTKFLPSEIEIREAIKASGSPKEAKRIAKENRDKVREDWDQIRPRVMKGILRLKIRQNPQLQDELLGTGEKLIYEDADMYAPDNPDEETIKELRRWGLYKGKDSEKTGENWLGNMLMEIRSELRETGEI